MCVCVYKVYISIRIIILFQLLPTFQLPLEITLEKYRK